MLTRRSLFGSLATAALGAPSVLKAALSCGPLIPPWNAQACTAGIPSAQLNTVYAAQQMNEWCWAACIEMVFAYYGHPVSQSEIVRQTWGFIANVPGQPSDIIRDLNRPWIDHNGVPFSVVGDVFSANAVTAAQDLSMDMPLIIGSLGHAMVLTAISYNRAIDGTGLPMAALVRDPWPGRGKRQLTPLEWAGTMLLVRIRVH